MKKGQLSQQFEGNIPFPMSSNISSEPGYISDPNHYHRETFGMPGESPCTLNNPSIIDEDASSAIESVGLLSKPEVTLAKESVRNGMLTNPFTVSEEELLGGGRLHSDISDGSPLIRMKDSFSARRSPTLIQRMAARSPEWRKELKIPIIKPIQTKSPSNHSTKPTVRSRFSPQRRDSENKMEQKSMILTSASPKQVPTVRRNSSTSGAIQEEDLMNSFEAEEVEPEIQNILDLEQYKQNQKLVESLRSKKYKNLFEKRGLSPTEGNLVAELKELLIETIEENRTLKAQKAFEDAIRVEDSSLTESPSPKAPIRNNNSDSLLKRHKKPVKKQLTGSLQMPPRAVKRAPVTKAVGRQSKMNPKNEESLCSRSSIRSRGAQRESDLESQRLANKQQLLQKQLREKDEIINRIMLDSYKKAQNIASMQIQIEKNKEFYDPPGTSQSRQMKRDWSQKTTEKEIIESNSASRASRAPSHRAYSDMYRFKGGEVLSERTDNQVDEQILHLAQNYASLAQNLQKELEASQKTLVEKDQRIKEILYRDSLLSSELHEKNMKIVSLRSERHKLKEEQGELKEILNQREQKYRALKKKVYQKLKEKSKTCSQLDQQIIQLKDVLKYYANPGMGMMRESVCGSCAGRATAMEESPYYKARTKGEPISRAKLPRASISTIGLDISEERENFSTNRPKYARLYDPERDYTPGQFSKTTFYPQSQSSLPTRHQESTKIQASQRLKDILDEAVFLTKLAGIGQENDQDKHNYSENPFQRTSQRILSRSIPNTSSFDYGRRAGGNSKTETELSRTLCVPNPQTFEDASNRFVSVSMFEDTPQMAERSVSPPQNEDDELGKLLRSNSSSSAQSYEEGRREVSSKVQNQLIELRAARSNIEGNRSLLELELSDRKVYQTPKRLTKHSRAYTAAGKKFTKT